VFRRRRRDGSPQEGDEVVEAEEALDEAADAPDLELPAGPRTPSGRPAGPGRERGPWDITEVVNPAAGGRVDLGGMWLPGRPGLEVRIEADQATSQVVAVTLVLGDGALQVQPFAAPRTENIWDEIRDEIRAGITKQGGTADEVEGPLGTELRTRVPVRAQDGSSGVQPARFVGVDGPRWFLRGVLTGRAAVEEGADAELVELFRDIVVVRGEGPMAPRDPIPLSLPASPSATTGAGEAGDETGHDAGGEGPKQSADLNPFERGPEITEIR
jgi:hypothetical protein